MTVTLHLEPEQEASLLAKAQASGMDVEHYLQALVRQEVSHSNRDVERARRSAAVRAMREFGDKYRLNFGEPITRPSIHEGHRF